jgi:hypothetical protein
MHGPHDAPSAHAGKRPLDVTNVPRAGSAETDNRSVTDLLDITRVYPEPAVADRPREREIVRLVLARRPV